jgi:hypothetical protein
MDNQQQPIDNQNSDGDILNYDERICITTAIQSATLITFNSKNF